MVVGAGNTQYVLLTLAVTLYVVSVQLWVDQLYLRLFRDASGVSIDANKAFMKSPAMNG
jgi:lipopolysaccharide export system protein LptC